MCTVRPSASTCALQHLAAALVDLQRHQPWRELDDVGFEAEQLQRVGRFEAEQATADDRADRFALRCGADRVEVVEGAVHEHAGQVAARDRRNERRRTRRQDQRVVGDIAAA